MSKTCEKALDLWLCSAEQLGKNAPRRILPAMIPDGMARQREVIL